MTKKAFAIAAHPDDIEFMMAGTLILLREAGYEIHMMNIANGSCGTMREDAAAIVRIRLDEARRAAEFAGAILHDPLVNDIEIFYEKSLLASVAAVMREVAPEILLVPSPQDYMEDHMNACRLAVTAAFCRGMRNFRVDPPRDIVMQDVTIYHAQPYGLRDYLGRMVQPDFFVDISTVLAQKTEMLAFHASQNTWLDESQGVSAYLGAMTEMAREMGQQSKSFTTAEGWRRHNHLGLCPAEANPMAAALGSRVIG